MAAGDRIVVRRAEDSMVNICVVRIYVYWLVQLPITSTADDEKWRPSSSVPAAGGWCNDRCNEIYVFMDRLCLFYNINHSNRTFVLKVKHLLTTNVCPPPPKDFIWIWILNF